MTAKISFSKMISLQAILKVALAIIVIGIISNIVSFFFEVSSNVSFISCTALFFAINITFQLLEIHSPIEARYQQIKEYAENLEKELSEIGESESEAEETISELKKAVVLMQAKKDEYKALASKQENEIKQIQASYKQKEASVSEYASKVEAKLSKMQALEIKIREQEEQIEILHKQKQALESMKFLGIPLSEIKEKYPDLLHFSWHKKEAIEAKTNFLRKVNGTAPKER